MDIIIKRAEKFCNNYFEGRVDNYEDLLDEVDKELYKIGEDFDKIKFINFVLERNNKDYVDHKVKCTNPKECTINFAHENIAYQLTRELNDLGVSLDEDTFTDAEKEQKDSKIDEILSSLNEIKIGQKILYEELARELEELKELYFLGKKKWHQILLGKGVDMMMGGIVSETVSKQIVADVSGHLPNLLT